MERPPSPRAPASGIFVTIVVRDDAFVRNIAQIRSQIVRAGFASTRTRQFIGAVLANIPIADARSRSHFRMDGLMAEKA
jgi:hypothetical protein